MALTVNAGSLMNKQYALAYLGSVGHLPRAAQSAWQVLIALLIKHVATKNVLTLVKERAV